MARGSGVKNSPLTTAEALLRSVRHNSVIRRRSKASAVAYYRAISQPARACPNECGADRLRGACKQTLV